jgi:hypothetical protein
VLVLVLPMLRSVLVLEFFVFFGVDTRNKSGNNHQHTSEKFRGGQHLSQNEKSSDACEQRFTSCTYQTPTFMHEQLSKQPRYLNIIWTLG